MMLPNRSLIYYVLPMYLHLDQMGLYIFPGQDRVVYWRFYDVDEQSLGLRTEQLGAHVCVGMKHGQELVIG